MALYIIPKGTFKFLKKKSTERLVSELMKNLKYMNIINRHIDNLNFI